MSYATEHNILYKSVFHCVLPMVYLQNSFMLLKVLIVEL
jgi:hypothetical protein